jgi:hypothetical protein
VNNTWHAAKFRQVIYETEEFYVIVGYRWLSGLEVGTRMVLAGNTRAVS